MQSIDLTKPQRGDDESIEDYILRYGAQVVRANRLHMEAIDRIADAPKPSEQSSKRIENTINARYRASRGTIVDFLAERPDLAARAKAGLYDPFEV